MFGIFKKFSHTNPYNPQIEVDTEAGAKKYLNSLSKLSFDGLCKDCLLYTSPSPRDS